MSDSAQSTRYFEDYEVGEKRTTMARTLTEADIVIHAGQSGDFYPHHMDAEWCKKQDFGERIAHGTLIFSVGIGLTAEEINPVAFTYGYDKLRFIKPVFIGDTISTVVSISEKREEPDRPGYGIVVEKCEVNNQDEELVMVCEHLLMVEQRDESS